MYRRWFFASLLGLGALIASATAWWPRPAPARLNVILLTVESTRADMVRPDTAPNLLAAAAYGLRFKQHRAISAWTAPNAVALLTGLDAYEQGIHAAGDTVPRDRELPLQRLSKAGWRVAGLQAFMRIDQFQHLGLLVEPGEAMKPWLARRWLEQKPFFLWYHYLETHLPYAPSAAFMPDWRKLLPPDDKAAAERIEQVMRQPSVPAGSVAFKPSDRAAVAAVHDATLREFDAWFGDFWRFFQASGLADDTILIVTADHGEEHLERGAVGHASTTHQAQLYEEIVRLPLFAWLPARLGQPPQRIAAPTDHRDVMPSILAWLVDARAPAPLLHLAGTRPWRALSSRAGFAEPDPDHVREFVAARIDGDWKRIERWRDGVLVGAELFHLSSDPAELHDRSAERPDIQSAMAAVMAADFAGRRVDDRSSPQATPGTAPRWVLPSSSQAVRYADIAGGIRLSWSGDAAVNYVLEYEAGEGTMSLKGRLDVAGLEKDFGRIDEAYWRSYVLPYGRIRIRVGLAGRQDAWSDWIELRALP